MPEREQRRDAVPVVVAIADEDAFLVADLAVEPGIDLRVLRVGRVVVPAYRETLRQPSARLGTCRTARRRWHCPPPAPDTRPRARPRPPPSHGISTGPPVCSTTMVRGLAAATAATSSSWRPGRRCQCRSLPSVSHSPLRPTKTRRYPPRAPPRRPRQSPRRRAAGRCRHAGPTMPRLRDALVANSITTA